MQTIKSQIKLFILLALLFVSSCEGSGSGDKTTTESVSVLIGNSNFSIPTPYVTEAESSGEGSAASRDRSGFIKMSLCLPELSPKIPSECDNSPGWGKVINVLISENTGRSYEEYFKEVIQHKINRKCLVNIGVASFSEDYQHYLDKNCGSDGPAKKRNWKDIYLITSPLSNQFFTMRCNRPRENYYPSCKVFHTNNNISVDYYFDRKHLDSFVGIHAEIVKLVQGFRI